MSFMDFELTEEELSEIRHMEIQNKNTPVIKPVPSVIVQHKSFIMDLTEQELEEIGLLSNDKSSKKKGPNASAITNNAGEACEEVDSSLKSRKNKERKTKKKEKKRDDRKEKKEKKDRKKKDDEIKTSTKPLEKIEDNLISQIIKEEREISLTASLERRIEIITSEEDFEEIDKYLEEKSYTPDDIRALKSLIKTKLEKNLIFRIASQPQKLINSNKDKFRDDIKLSLKETDKDADNNNNNNNNNNNEKGQKKTRGEVGLKPKKKRHRVNSGLSNSSPTLDNPTDLSLPSNVIATLDLHTNEKKGRRRKKSEDLSDPYEPHSAESISPRSNYRNYEGNSTMSNVKSGVMKIRLPNSSHKSFPINEQSTAGEIIEKLRNKLNLEQPGNAWNECVLFELKGKEISLPSSTKLLPIFISGSEFIFKKPGEKEVNREEELQRIMRQNENLRKEKQKLMDQSFVYSKRGYDFSLDRRNFLFAEYTPNHGSVDQISLAMNKIQLLLQDLNGYREKFDSLKKLKKIPVDISDVLVLKKLSDKTQVVIYTALVSGWTVILKEFLLSESYSVQTLNQINNEIALLDSLPYHPNIVKYLFHQKSSKRVRLYLSYYTCSLRELINKRKENNVPFHTKEIKKLILGIIDGVTFLHSYCIVHRYLSPDNIFCNLDSSSDLTKVKDNVSNICIGGYDHAFQMGGNIMSKLTFEKPSIYTPPETNQLGFNYSSDIYSVGIILFELLTLSPPKDHNELTALADRHQPDPSILSKLSPSAQMVAVVLQCINKIISQRPNPFQLKEIIEGIPDEHIISSELPQGVNTILNSNVNANANDSHSEPRLLSPRSIGHSLSG